MEKLQFVDKDLKGKIINQKPKDSRSVEIEGQSRFCGHRFLLKTKLYGDKRCLYCGRWFHWKDTEVLTYLREGNIDPYNADNVYEPLHCGSSHCKDYHEEYKRQVEIRKQRIIDNDMWKLFQDLKTKGIVK